MPNPFTNRGMITDPAQFFGRVSELDAIFSRLEPDQPQSVSVVGENRIGRSSLLWHIKQTYPARLPKPQRYRVGYLDAMSARANPDVFRAHMLTALGANANGTEAISALSFESALQNLCDAGHSLVLLLDELESLTEFPDKFNDEFFDWARAVLNRHLLTLVTTSAISLPQIASQRKFLSTFFGLFTQVELGDFAEAEARDFLQQPSDRPLRESHVRFVLDVVGSRHPCKLAMAADHVYQRYGDGGWDEAKAAQARAGYQHDVQFAWSAAPAVRADKARRKLIERAKAFGQTLISLGIKAAIEEMKDPK